MASTRTFAADSSHNNVARRSTSAAERPQDTPTKCRYYREPSYHSLLAYTLNCFYATLKQLVYRKICHSAEKKLLPGVVIVTKNQQ